MDADRRREVARRLLALAESRGAEALFERDLRQALRAAAEALEEMGEAPPGQHAQHAQVLQVWLDANRREAEAWRAGGGPEERERFAAMAAAIAALAPKPSAASMEERIRALEGEIRKMRAQASPYHGESRKSLEGRCERIRQMATAALGEEPDPERDRETRAEVERDD